MTLVDGLLSAAMVVLVALAALRRHRLLAFGLSWWLLALTPTAMLALLNWPGLNRWLYIGLPGLVLGLQQLVGMALSRFSLARFGTWLVAGLALTYCALLQLAIPVWKSNSDLYYRTIMENPDDAFGYRALGISRYNLRRYEDAEFLLRKSLEMDPGNGDAALYLAMTLAQRGACAEASMVYHSYPRSSVSPDKLEKLLSHCLEEADR
jgi:tetratricopeptide (TPR) repeat protein